MSKQVKKNTQVGVNARVRPEIAPALKAARKRLNLSQDEFSQTLGTNQKTYSRWEGGKQEPAPSFLVVVADLVPDLEKPQWLEWAGLKPTPISPRDNREIAVLKDAAAAGTPRAIDEREIGFRLSLPPQLFPPGGKLFGLPVQGDSMSPVLESGYIAIVDITRREPKRLVNRMVAARDEDGGVTIKWLRYQEPVYLLVPQNTSPRHPVRIITSDSQFGIVGEVVKWIGEPSLPRKG